MTFYKILSIIIVIFSAVLSNAWAMNDELKANESTHVLGTRKKVADEKAALVEKEEICRHWGLERWCCGISEYFLRSFCCIMPGQTSGCCCCEKPDCTDRDIRRKYHVYRKFNNQQHLESTSDCYCIAYALSNKNTELDCYFHNPCTGTCCLPIAGLPHLICLPFALCDRHENYDKMEVIEKVRTYTYISPEQKLENQKACEHYLETPRHKDCGRGYCLVYSNKDNCPKQTGW